MNQVDFRIDVWSDDGRLYFEWMPVTSIPRVGEDVYVPGGIWWRVTEVAWQLPDPRGDEPVMIVRLHVERSPINDRPRPTHDDHRWWDPGHAWPRISAHQENDDDDDEDQEENPATDEHAVSQQTQHARVLPRSGHNQS